MTFPPSPANSTRSTSHGVELQPLSPLAYNDFKGMNTHGRVVRDLTPNLPLGNSTLTASEETELARRVARWKDYGAVIGAIVGVTTCVVLAAVSFGAALFGTPLGFALGKELGERIAGRWAISHHTRNILEERAIQEYGTQGNALVNQQKDFGVENARGTHLVGNGRTASIVPDWYQYGGPITVRSLGNYGLQLQTGWNTWEDVELEGRKENSKIILTNSMTFSRIEFLGNEAKVKNHEGDWVLLKRKMPEINTVTPYYAMNAATQSSMLEQDSNFQTLFMDQPTR